MAGEPSTSSFVTEVKGNPSFITVDTAAKVEMKLTPNEPDIKWLTEDVEDAIEEYLQKHADIELYLLNN